MRLPFVWLSVACAAHLFGCNTQGDDNSERGRDGLQPGTGAMSPGMGTGGGDGSATSAAGGTAPTPMGDGTLVEGGSNTGSNLPVLDAGATHTDGGTTMVVQPDPDLPPTSFRVTSLELVDPHIFVLAVDVTAQANDTMLTPALVNDVDPADGFVDLSFVSVFRPLDPARPELAVDLVFADCSAPVGSTRCGPKASQAPAATVLHNQDSGSCLTPMAATLGGYDPPPNDPVGPCYVSDPESLTFSFAGISMQLEETRVAATYSGGAQPTSLINGVVQGFLTKERADAIEIPEDRPLVGGFILGKTFLDKDLDTGPGGVSGYWVYMNFEAGRVSYSDGT
ncbi:MAG: hypothetical protein OEZ06_12690 [Myxococcales bacterium]|nr:hypothetical protein [Myxococcales bacterium]